MLFYHYGLFETSLVFIILPDMFAIIELYTEEQTQFGSSTINTSLYKCEGNVVVIKCCGTR